MIFVLWYFIPTPCVHPVAHSALVLLTEYDLQII